MSSTIRKSSSGVEANPIGCGTDVAADRDDIDALPISKGRTVVSAPAKRVCIRRSCDSELAMLIGMWKVR